ncbi:helix-turn-helix transcriptional regulator [Arenibacter sp. 6A1]|uniref:helix-turn-helix domain-containing protein n=1 Tax=Arenibacter sp. 6A1 TaxID=2720391 RepID=UPI00144704D6|nr:AraC family transcriptional regulator [Arenibacter sp. 6A1]NKI26609.1 helix-turn-helix transcriptional regulator [Arenibacter sp. 6A1]
MKKKILVKNMVCNRCISFLEQEFKKVGLVVVSISLGEIVFLEKEGVDEAFIESLLNKNGFELVKEVGLMVNEQLKIACIEAIDNLEAATEENLSAYLSKKLKKDYSVLSKMFSKQEGITIERYYINLKIEKVKELIQLQHLNFSEIAYSLNYKSSSHLAAQFKSVTGMSMSDYKNLQQWDRKSLDQIV